MDELIAAATEWVAARHACIEMPIKDPNYRPVLNRLSNAEDALSRATRKLLDK